MEKIFAPLRIPNALQFLRSEINKLQDVLDSEEGELVCLEERLLLLPILVLLLLLLLRYLSCFH